jgi:hypothetical protein
MIFLRAVAITLFSAVCCSAQHSETAASGTVTGHVICADTNGPARIAHVVLQPVVDNTSDTKTTSTGRPRVAPTTLVETLLDGSFTVSNVSPGNYYVFVEKPGYLSPLALLSREDLNHPTPRTSDLIAKLLTPVSVAANRISTVEVRILKGAVISGTVRFDDGSPSSNAGIKLLTREKPGKWEPFRTRQLASGFGADNTDDQGRYRLSGLPAGEYLVKTDLTLSDITVDRVFGEQRSSSNYIRYSLDIYFGDSLRQRDAKPVKLEEGQEYGTGDITIPISKLHSVSGSLVEAGTGHVINAGKIVIAYPDDDSEVASTEIGKDDNAFHFYYVPEGEYVLRATGARDVTREEVAYPPGTMPPTHTEEKKIRDYDAQPQPIVIHSDATGVILLAQPRPAGSAPVKAQ